MSVKQSQLKKQILEKRTELKNLQDEYKRLDDLVFRLVNQPSQYQADMARLQSMRKESTKLRRLLGVQTKEELLGALQQVCARRDKECERRKSQVSALRAQKKELEAELEQINIKAEKSTPSASVHLTTSDVNISELASEIKEFKDKLASTRAEIQQKIDEAKHSIQALLRDIYEAAMKEFGNYDVDLICLQQEQSDLEHSELEEKEKLSELEKSHSDIKSPLVIEEDPAEVESEHVRVLQLTQKVLSDASNRLQGAFSDHSLILNINMAIDNFAVSIDRIRAKLAKFASMIDAKKELASTHSKDECLAQAKDNLRLLLRLGSKHARVQTLLDRIAPEVKAQTDRIILQIEREERDQSPVGDTNMTISELRREICRLEKEIFRENFFGERFIEEMNMKRKEYQRLTEALVEGNT